jgi:RHH-type proline utilization regulon transcriptional repressor/proline dehydrogenase/delta 1-pyrroline-5-carboxylate dehydrogenase
MATTTLGVKLDDPTRERLKAAATAIDRTPHWLIKQAIFNYLERLEGGASLSDLNGLADKSAEELGEILADPTHQCFLEFAESILPQSVLRAAITGAYRRPEPEVVPMLLEQARLPAGTAEAANKLAAGIAEKLRNQKSAGGRAGIVQGLLQEFSLSSQEGVALMCLAEALLRIPDKGTRDALIRDKISNGNWQPHLGNSPSLFVNAATWGLLLTGKLVSTHNEAGLTSSLGRIIGRSGEPMIRKGVDMAMRLMGEQFVTGETIAEALANASKFESKGFRYSYDMLGEAALTEHDAQKYLASYEQAIHSIGKASHGRGIYEGPGISIKLSALHPRYSRAQYERVMTELYPRLLSLTLLAKQYDIGLNIDAEEADRLELSLDLLERLCFEPQLTGWNGIGFVIQAYQKRCPYVIDYVIDLARRSRHRLMIRLVKGAYWDSEIKRAQVEGLEGYPVYTRKVYTDVSYIACARKLLAAPEVIYPQFATHNAHTLAAIYHIAGQNYYPGQYEFQCLHGMGEPLYEQVVGKVADGKLNRPCRVYAPVGTHETLLAYLVRRLLENGANTSFVNRIADQSISIQELVADPVSTIEQMATQEGSFGLPHPRIPLPRDLYGPLRANSAGIDLANEHRLASLSSALLATAHTDWSAAPMLGSDSGPGPAQPVLNPSDLRDVVGHVQEATVADVDQAILAALAAGPIWQATPPDERAAILERAADLMEGEIQPLMGLLAREAGKTFANAIAEVREAVDFLRYYAVQARNDFSNDAHRPLGPVVCISPWNFPLAIFSGQVAAALAAGNPVLAKPAEQTPLVAAQAVRLLLEAGIPPGVVQLLPGPGETVGARLVGDERVKGVMFTGSTEVARLLQRNIAGRLDAMGRPIPLIAETGGQNAMIVDSSALTEQVVIDVVSSAFDSAGQRCSALRVLCLQEDSADRVLDMLKGAMAEARLGNPERLSVDIGPVIDAEAKAGIEKHIQAMRDKGRSVYQMAIADGDELKRGTFVMPTLIELDSFDELQREIFGPVLHVVRYKRRELDQLIAQINASGYGLTLGVHTRIDETIAKVIDNVNAGNVYVNRNIVGAVVGVQPFGGEGLSGTGPKAGGPLYLYRLRPTASPAPSSAATPTASRTCACAMPWRNHCGRCKPGPRPTRAGPWRPPANSSPRSPRAASCACSMAPPASATAIPSCPASTCCAWPTPRPTC